MKTCTASNANLASTQVIIRKYFHEISGNLHLVEDVKSFPSGFRVRNFIIQTESYRPDPIIFVLLGDDVILTDEIPLGSRIKVIFQVKGREWQGKFFNNLEVNSIEVLELNEQNTQKSSTTEKINEEALVESIPF